MSANEAACFCQSHYHTCFARNFFSPTDSKKLSISCKLNCRMFFVFDFMVAVSAIAQRYFKAKRRINYATYLANSLTTIFMETIAERIIQKIEQLPFPQKEYAIDFVEFLFWKYVDSKSEDNKEKKESKN